MCTFIYKFELLYCFVAFILSILHFCYLTICSVFGQLLQIKIADSGVSRLFANHDVIKQHRLAWYDLSVIICWVCCSLILPSPPLDNIRVMVIVWRLRGNIIRTAPCWVVWRTVHSQQHTYVSSSYRSSRLGLSHWDPYTVHRGGCLELYYCNMVKWSWWDSSLISKTNWFPSVLWHCWFGHMTCKNRPRNDL